MRARWKRWRPPARSGAFWRDHLLDVLGTSVLIGFMVVVTAPFWLEATGLQG